MGQIRLILIALCCLMLTSCEPDTIALSNRYRLMRMNALEVRLVTPENSVLPSNIASYNLISRRYVVGECTKRYLDSEADAADGFFILDSETGEYKYGLSHSEFSNWLRKHKFEVARPMKVLLPTETVGAGAKQLTETGK